MIDQQIERYRRKLLGLRDELESSLDSQRDDTVPVSPDRAIGRLTRQDAMLAQQIGLELKRRNGAWLGQVRRVLERVNDGDYD